MSYVRCLTRMIEEASVLNIQELWRQTRRFPGAEG